MITLFHSPITDIEPGLTMSAQKTWWFGKRRIQVVKDVTEYKIKYTWSFKLWKKSIVQLIFVKERENK